MKKIIGVVVLLLLLVGCSSNNKKVSKQTKESSTSVVSIEKEPTKKQKERLVKLTEEELKKKKVEYDTKDSQWKIQLKKEKSKEKWTIIKQDSKVKEIKVIFEWDGKDKTVPKLISLLVNGKEPTEPKKEPAKTETSSSENEVLNITPSQFIGNWYQIGGGAEIVFTETTSNNSENSEVTQEGKYTRFMHNGQPQADIKGWIYQDANLGEVLEVTYINSGSTIPFTRIKEQQKPIENQNREKSLAKQQNEHDGLRSPYNPEPLFEAQVEKTKQEIRNYFAERTVGSTGQPYRDIDVIFNNVFNFISPYQEPYVYANSDEELLNIISPLFQEYKQKVIDTITDESERYYRNKQ